MKFDRSLLNDDIYYYLGHDRNQDIYCLRNIIYVNVSGFLIVDIHMLRVRKRSADSFTIKMLLHINSNNKVYKTSYVLLEKPNKSIIIDNNDKEYIIRLRNYIMENNNLEIKFQDYHYRISS